MVKLKDSGFPVGAIIEWGGDEYEVKFGQDPHRSQNVWWAQRFGANGYLSGWISGDANVTLVRLPDNLPKTWGQMTPEEKGALLLAHHEGKIIQWSSSEPLFECDGDKGNFNEWRTCPNAVGKYDQYAYRVKPPEPVRTTITMYGHKEGQRYYFGPTKVHSDRYKITFDEVDGKPDLNSILMEKL